MQEEIIQYTIKEGGQWLDWPFGKLSVKLPPVMILPEWKVKIKVWNIFYIEVHSFRLKDKREWDTINGFRATSHNLSSA
jgi:hypothetical protein